MWGWAALPATGGGCAVGVLEGGRRGGRARGARSRGGGARPARPVNESMRRSAGAGAAGAGGRPAAWRGAPSRQSRAAVPVVGSASDSGSRPRRVLLDRSRSVSAGPPHAAGVQTHGNPESGCHTPQPRRSAQRPGVCVFAVAACGSLPVSGSNLHVYLAGRCSSEVSVGRLVQVRKSNAGRAPCAPPEVHPMHSPISDRLLR